MVREAWEEDVTDTEVSSKDKETHELGLGKEMQIFQNALSIDLKGFYIEFVGPILHPCLNSYSCDYVYFSLEAKGSCRQKW